MALRLSTSVLLLTALSLFVSIAEPYRPHASAPQAKDGLCATAVTKHGYKCEEFESRKVYYIPISSPCRSRFACVVPRGLIEDVAAATYIFSVCVFVSVPFLLLCLFIFNEISFGISGVIIARILGDYLLANLVEYLVVYEILNPVLATINGEVVYASVTINGKVAFDGFPPMLASAIVNGKDGLAGICGVIGAILVDVYLTNEGMIFLSSLLYGLGFVFLICGSLSGGLGQTGVGIFLAGSANLSLMNSSNNLAKDQRDANRSNTNFLTNIIEFLFGNDTDVSRLAQAHGYVILLIFIKYTAKVVFIVASMILGSIFETPDEKGYKYRMAVVYAQFLLPTGALLFMALMSLANFRTFVKKVEDRGTPLKRVMCVCIRAFSKRRLLCPQNLHQGNPEHPLTHTNSLRFLDKAAIIDPSQPAEQQGICTVTEVEETKCLLRMVPMCMTFLLYGMVKSVGNTFFLLQGIPMDASLGKQNIQVPLQTLIIIGDISGLVTKGLYILLISKRLSGSGKKYGPPIKYAIGIVLATFCCTVASWTAADKNAGDSVFWLTPQFLLFGAMTEVTRDGIQGFFNDQLPPSVRRYDSVFTDAMIGAGAILCAALVYATHSSRVDIFYRLLTVVCFIILSGYTFVATRYSYQDNKEAQSNQDIQG